MVNLSFDIGTTNIKSMVTRNEKILEVQSVRLETHQEGLTMTQDPSVILDIIKKRIQAVDKTYGLESFVLVTAMHTLILLNQAYQPMEPMMLWSDNRGESVADVSNKKMLQYYFRTGTPYHPMSPFVKLKTFDQGYLANCLISDLKAYLMVHLTGEFVSDVSSASASGLMNIHTQSWDQKILNELMLKQDHLPIIKPCDFTTTTHCFDRPIGVMVGSTDGVMANLGTQTSNRQCVLSVGTSVGIRTLSDVRILDSKGKTFCYCAPNGQFLIGNASNNGGNLYDYIAHHLFDGHLSFEDFIEMIGSGIPKTYATPFVFGERGPFWIKNLRLTFSEQSVNNQEKAQAIIYGMLSNIYLLKQSIASVVSSDPICLTGGFFNDTRLVQLLADLCQHDVICVEDENAVCVAAMHLLTQTPIHQTSHRVKHKKNNALIQYRAQASAYIMQYVDQKKRSL